MDKFIVCDKCKTQAIQVNIDLVRNMVDVKYFPCQKCGYVQEAKRVVQLVGHITKGELGGYNQIRDYY